MIATLKKSEKLKNMFEKVNPQFAWQVMSLQIELQQSQNQEIQDLMNLIQLYMMGVEILENADDKRYTYFNNKIHSLMLKKNVIEKLHLFTTGLSTEDTTLQLVQKKEMQNKKSEYELQLYLQKQSYTINSIKDFLSRQEQNKMKRESNIKTNVKMQHQKLQRRISDRKLRSSSKNKLQSAQKLPQTNMVIKQSSKYSTSTKEKPDKLTVQNDD